MGFLGAGALISSALSKTANTGSLGISLHQDQNFDFLDICEKSKLIVVNRKYLVKRL
jgi:hypothetical protein